MKPLYIVFLHQKIDQKLKLKTNEVRWNKVFFAWSNWSRNSGVHGSFILISPHPPPSQKNPPCTTPPSLFGSKATVVGTKTTAKNALSQRKKYICLQFAMKKVFYHEEKGMPRFYVSWFWRINRVLFQVLKIHESLISKMQAFTSSSDEIW